MDAPNEPLLDYILTRMIEQDPDKAKCIMLLANVSLKNALKRVQYLEEKHKDWGNDGSDES